MQPLLMKHCGRLGGSYDEFHGPEGVTAWLLLPDHGLAGKPYSGHNFLMFLVQAVRNLFWTKGELAAIGDDSRRIVWDLR